MKTRSLSLRAFLAVVVLLGLLTLGETPISSAEPRTSPNAPVGFSTQLLFLDTISDSPLIGTSTFDVGMKYIFQVSGTYSNWYAWAWDAGACGHPENFPTNPSPNVQNGKVGADAAYLFAIPNGWCPSPPPALPQEAKDNFQISLDGGANWFHPSPDDNRFQTDHRYEYTVSGQGFPPQFRLIDYPNSDNYGILTIEILTTPVFLELPYDYTGSSFLVESKDTDLKQGGKVNAYFDHQYPTYGNPPNTGGYGVDDLKAVNFYGYDGTQTNPPPPYRIQYNGHDGIDFWLGQGTHVLAAATGKVIAANWDNCKGYYVQIQHDNFYVTEYRHLDHFAPGIAIGTRVYRTSINDPNALIGYVGNKGSCSGGYHLHFSVYNLSGALVDPYGWEPQVDAKWFGLADPWQVYNATKGIDSTSIYLWTHLLDRRLLSNPGNPTVITLGWTTATFPVGASAGTYQIELRDSLTSPLIANSSAVPVSTFALYAFDQNAYPIWTLSQPAQIQVKVNSNTHAPTRSRASTPQYTIYHWDTATNSWVSLPSTYDAQSDSVSASSNTLGQFAVMQVGTQGYQIFMPFIARSSINLAINGGFEDGNYSPSGSPTGWTRDAWIPQSTTMTWDNTVSKSGTKSVKIAQSTGNDARWIETVTVQPNRNYRLSGWIKTSQVAQGSGANIGIYGTWDHTQGIIGTNDWTFVSMSVNSGSSTQLTLACRLGYWSGESSGTMWCDDITLELIN